MQELAAKTAISIIFSELSANSIPIKVVTFFPALGLHTMMMFYRPTGEKILWLCQNVAFLKYKYMIGLGVRIPNTSWN